MAGDGSTVVVVVVEVVSADTGSVESGTGSVVSDATGDTGGTTVEPAVVVEVAVEPAVDPEDLPAPVPEADPALELGSDPSPDCAEHGPVVPHSTIGRIQTGASVHFAV